MRDLAILEEWLNKLRKDKRDMLHRSALSVASLPDAFHASNRAHEIEMITVVIDGVRLLESDPSEFVKRHLP